MNGFGEIFRFECRYQLRSPLFAGCAAAFAFIHFVAALRAGINIGLQAIDSSQLALNAVFSIIQNEAVLSVFGMFPALVFAATAITRDHDRNTAETFFAAPISANALFFGRFAGGLLAASLVGIAGLLGTAAALSMPWIDPQQLDAFSLAPYWFSLFLVVLPNTLIVCALFYGVAALSRSMGAAFAALLVFLAAATSFANDPDALALTAVLEPTGVSALIADARYWTSAQLATELPAGWIFVNRAVWIATALGALLVASLRYRFRLDGSDFGSWSLRRRNATPAPALRSVSAVPHLGGFNALRQLGSLLRMDLRSILLSVPFYVVLAICVINAVAYFNSDTFELFQRNRTVPVTSQMLDFFRFAMLQSVFLVVLYYSGQLVHRDRQFRVAGIIDASPFPDGLSVIAKVLALCLVVTLMSLIAAATFVALQAASGYTNFEFGVYATGIFGLNAPNYYVLCVLAILVQVVSPSKWLGMLIILVLFVASQVSRFFGLDHGLYGFSVPYFPHSDMNGFGDFEIATASFIVYWAAFCALLIVAGHLLYPRGLRDGLSQWITDARERMRTNVLVLTCLFGVVFAGTGGWIFYNTNVLNDYVSLPEALASVAEYERLYDRYQERVGSQAAVVDIEVDIYPDERRVESRGTATLVNTETAAIDELPLFVNPQLTVNELTVSGASIVESNPAQGFYLFGLDTPSPVGGELELHWDLSWVTRGFRNGTPDLRLAGNGTYLETLDIVPHGYDAERELTDDNIRRRYGLAPVERLSPDDPQPPDLMRAAMAVETDVRVVVGTSADQIALAQGRLVREWREDDRRYFEYRGGGVGNAPVWPALMIGSARYAVASDEWNGVPIEIYYDPKHPYAIETMLRTARRGLDYYTHEFAPYQYDSYRMFEIPRYHSFARASTGIVSYSEAVGFLGTFDDEQIDFATAHELAHQWWGAQVMGASLPGSARINETLANYSALMLIGEFDGEYAANRMYMDMRDEYLTSRNFEPGDGGEAPLIRADSMKSYLVLYALQDLIGKERLHLALRRFLERYSFLARYNAPPPPFPTSREFVAEIRAVAGDQYQQLITDLYERVTFYDLRVTGASSRPIEGGFEVQIEVAARQLDATNGLEIEVPLSGDFDLAVFPERGKGAPLAQPIYLEKHRLESGTQSFTIVVESQPARVGVDPYGKMIDRNINDNVRDL